MQSRDELIGAGPGGSPLVATSAGFARRRTGRDAAFAAGGDLPGGSAPAFTRLAGLGTGALVAVASLGGLLSTTTYAGETASISAQCLGQDWFDLLLVAPLLALSTGPSRRARLVLGGAFAYTAYTFSIYAFSIHFNALFLVYCAALGLSVYGLAATCRSCGDVSGWTARPVARRLVGGLQLGIAAAFALLWLADIVPALAAGRAPLSVSKEGLLTNPVHVLDLSLALPALALSGVALWRGRPLGSLLSPILLTLSTLMSLSIGAMMVSASVRGTASDSAVAVVFVFVAGACAVALVHLLRRVRTGDGETRSEEAA